MLAIDESGFYTVSQKQMVEECDSRSREPFAMQALPPEGGQVATSSTQYQCEDLDHEDPEPLIEHPGSTIKTPRTVSERKEFLLSLKPPSCCDHERLERHLQNISVLALVFLCVLIVLLHLELWKLLRPGKKLEAKTIHREQGTEGGMRD